MKPLAIVLVGGAAKIAADGISGVLALLRLYIRPKGRNKYTFNCFLEYACRSYFLERRREKAIAPLLWLKWRNSIVNSRISILEKRRLLPYEGQPQVQPTVPWTAI